MKWVLISLYITTGTAVVDTARFETKSGCMYAAEIVSKYKDDTPVGRMLNAYCVYDGDDARTGPDGFTLPDGYELME